MPRKTKEQVTAEMMASVLRPSGASGATSKKYLPRETVPGNDFQAIEVDGVEIFRPYSYVTFETDKQALARAFPDDKDKGKRTIAEGLTAGVVKRYERNADGSPVIKGVSLRKGRGWTGPSFSDLYMPHQLAAFLHEHPEAYQEIFEAFTRSVSSVVAATLAAKKAAK